jgi:SAM-dependent methyltransferase
MQWPPLWPPVGLVRFGNLRRLRPISRDGFGWDRGLPVDRYYIEQFLARHAEQIRGRVLEVADNAYTRRFGGARVVQSDILHVRPDNRKATLVGDLADADHIPSDAFDCIILTQTLQYIPEVRAAVMTLQRILRPGGILLVTIPGISQISRSDMEQWGEYWRFTALSARWLFETAFPAANVVVEAHGSVLAAIAFLHGLAAEELRPQELAWHDPDYEVLITVRAVKPTIRAVSGSGAR